MSAVPRVYEYKLGRRLLRAGDIVEVNGQRNSEFRITYFEADTVTVYGGKRPSGKYGALRNVRTFTVDRIGRRVAMADRPRNSTEAKQASTSKRVGRVACG